MLSEDDFLFVCFTPPEAGDILESSVLAPFEKVLATLQARADAGLLKTACFFTLDYTCIQRPTDPAPTRQRNLSTCQGVPAPTWELLCHDAGRTAAIEAAYSWNLSHRQPDASLSQYAYLRNTYGLRLDARTGELLFPSAFSPIPIRK